MSELSAQDAVLMRSTEEVPGMLRRVRLHFADREVEAKFRAAERERNLQQARIACLIIAVLQVAFALFSPLLYRHYGIAFMTLQIFGIAGSFLVIAGLTYLNYFRTRWPVLLLLGEYIFTVSYCFQVVIGAPPEYYIAFFSVAILAVYVLLPLIFSFGVFAATTSSLIFFAVIWWWEVFQGLDLVVIIAQVVCANILGAFVLYRSERHRRLDFQNLREVAGERRRYQELLMRILPRSIAERMQAGEQRIADEIEAATVLFVDIAGFTAMATKYSANEVITMLDETFSRFDDLVDHHGLEKIKTMGDSYMVVAGAPEGRSDHCDAMARLALDMKAAVAESRDPGGDRLRVRIGLHTGPLIAGVIGRQRFLYDLWGDTVNTASRMESMSDLDEIQISDELRQGLRADFRITPRGEIEVKGKGLMKTWFLTGLAA